MDTVIETLEEWFDRISNMPVWREIAWSIEKHTAMDNDEYQKALAILVKAFSKDLLSLRWTDCPKQVSFEVYADACDVAQVFVLSASAEITREVPSKEKLWRAMRSLFEEMTEIKKKNLYLFYSIAALEKELEEAKNGNN